MATSIISNTVTNPSGTALEGVPVVVRLVPGGGFRISDSSEVTPKVTTVTDSSGDWSLVLEENANITPANSYYEVEEQLTAAQGGPRKFTFEVGAADSTLYAALINPINDITSSNYLTQAAADARYMLLSGGFGVAGDMVDSRPADTANAGTLAFAARIDHRHEREDLSGTAAERAALSGNYLFAGLQFHETDTGKVMLYTGSEWWCVGFATTTLSSYTPTLSQGASTNIAKTVTTAKYIVANGVCEVWIILGPTASGTAGSDVVFTLPVAGAAIGFAGIGSGNIFDSSASTIDAGQWIMLSATTVSLRTSESTVSSWGTTPNIAIANGDGIWAHLRYPIAAAA